MKSVFSILLPVSLACLVHSGRCTEDAILDASDCVAKCSEESPVQVCGDDLQTYDSECHMKCAGVKRYYAGPCIDWGEDICICPDVYLPVCGSDGELYTNTCRMHCAGIKKEGECSSVESLLT